MKRGGGLTATHSIGKSKKSRVLRSEREWVFDEDEEYSGEEDEEDLQHLHQGDGTAVGGLMKEEGVFSADGEVQVMPPKAKHHNSNSNSNKELFSDQDHHHHHHSHSSPESKEPSSITSTKAGSRDVSQEADEHRQPSRSMSQPIPSTQRIEGGEDDDHTAAPASSLELRLKGGQCRTLELSELAKSMLRSMEKTRGPEIL